MKKTIKKVKQTASVMLVVAVLAASLPETGMYVHAVEQESATEPSSIDGEMEIEIASQTEYKEDVALITKYNYGVCLNFTVENANGGTMRVTTPEIKLKQGAKNPVVEKVELVSNTDAFQYENNKISFKEKLMIGFLA